VLPVGPLAAGHARRHRQRDDLVVVGSMPVRAADGRRSDVASRIYAHAYDGHCAALVRGDAVLESLWFGNISLRREHCLGVGVRSSAFTSVYHADRDFGYRLADAGLTGVFDDSLRADHLHARSVEAFLLDACRRGSGLRMLHRVHPERLGPFSPELLMTTSCRPLDVAVQRMVGTARRRTAVSTFLMRWGALAGRLHLHAVETFLARGAQHIMQWHGAVDAAAT
jgi:hypothetical protein